jgi:hypothetical protein
MGHVMQARAFQQFHATMKREYEAVASCPKWWASSPQIVRTFMFVVAYLDRREDLVPPEFKQDYLATLRLLPIMSEEFVKASVLPRNRMMRVRCLFLFAQLSFLAETVCQRPIFQRLRTAGVVGVVLWSGKRYNIQTSDGYISLIMQLSCCRCCGRFACLQ